MNNWNNEDGTIKWTKSDIARLKKAVNNFNQKRQRLVNKEKSLEKENRIVTNTIARERVSEIMNETLTRKQLNETIKTLRAFSKRNAENLDETHFQETGQKLTTWQHDNVIKRNIEIAKVRLNKELDEYKKEVKGSRGLVKTRYEKHKSTSSRR